MAYPRPRSGEIDVQGIPGPNQLYSSQGEARSAALALARRLGPGFTLAHDPRPARGLPHYHIVAPDGRRVPGHVFYGRRMPRRQLRDRPSREHEAEAELEATLAFADRAVAEEMLDQGLLDMPGVEQMHQSKKGGKKNKGVHQIGEARNQDDRDRSRTNLPARERKKLERREADQASSRAARKANKAKTKAAKRAMKKAKPAEAEWLFETW